MLTTIQDLEHEIEEFRNNIKDSSQLIEMLDSVVRELKSQTESFESRSKSICETVDKVPHDVGGIFEAKAEDTVRKINETVEKKSAEQVTRLEEIIQRNIVQLKDTEKQVIEASEHLEKKCNDFEEELAKTNVGSIYQLCLDINKSMKTKFLLVLCGISIAVVLSVLSFILR